MPEEVHSYYLNFGEEKSHTNTKIFIDVQSQNYYAQEPSSSNRAKVHSGATSGYKRRVPSDSRYLMGHGDNHQDFDDHEETSHHYYFNPP
jgi:hypothetical protein